MDKVIKTQYGEEVTLTDKTSDWSDRPDDSGYLLLKLDNFDRTIKVKFRNCVKKNPASALQFEIETCKKSSKRNFLSSFSVPKELMGDFIKHLSNGR
jgi:hypothetical protein